MASFVSTIRADKNLEASGVWVTLSDPNRRNEDGTFPEFKIKRVSITNTAYQAKINPIIKRIDTLNASNSADAGEVLSLHLELIRVYLDNMLVDWRNIKDDVYDPKTGERVYNKDHSLVFEEIPYSKENARELLATAEALDVTKWLMEQSGTLSNFTSAHRQADLKA